MNLLAPIQLAWAAAALVVVLLYVHWAIRKTRQTTTLPIWRHTIARRSRWSRWRKPVSLLTACAPILLVALALARPFLSPFVESSRTIVIVVDNTASMNAQPRGRSRLEQAKRAARRLIRNLRTHDRMAILSADSAVRLRCGLTNDRTALHLALDEVQPTDGTGGMHECLDVARRLVENEPRAVVVVVSDAAFDLEDGARDEVVWLPVGGPSDNIAITHLAARPAPGAANSQQVLIEVANFGEESADVTVEFRLHDKSLPAMDVQLPAGNIVRRALTVNADTPALLTARIDVDDALAADNQAQLLVAPQPAARVLLVTSKEESPLQAALRSLSGVEVATAESLPGELDDVDVLVFAGTLPEQIPKLPTLVMKPATSTSLWAIQSEANNPQAAIAPHHPLLYGVDLRDVIIEQAPRLELQDGATAVVSSTAGDPLLALHPRPAGDVVVLNFSSDNSDIQWHDDFPRLLSNAVAWLTRSDSSPRSAWKTNESIAFSDTGEIPELASPYGVLHNGGAVLSDAGIWQSGQAAVLPVNLANALESDVRLEPTDLNRAWPHVSWLPDFGPLWMPLVALALVWLAAQWAFYQREVID